MEERSPCSVGIDTTLYAFMALSVYQAMLARMIYQRANGRSV